MAPNVARPVAVGYAAFIREELEARKKWINELTQEETTHRTKNTKTMIFV